MQMFLDMTLLIKGSKVVLVFPFSLKVLTCFPLGIWEGFRVTRNQSSSSLGAELVHQRQTGLSFETFRRPSVRSTGRSQRDQSPALSLQDINFNSAVSLVIPFTNKDKKTPRLSATTNYHRRTLALQLCGLLAGEDEQDIIKR
jgi:hypothetical protein